MKVRTGYPFSAALFKSTSSPFPCLPSSHGCPQTPRFRFYLPERPSGFCPAYVSFVTSHGHTFIARIPSLFVRVLPSSKGDRKENLGFAHTFRTRSPLWIYEDSRATWYNLQGMDQCRLSNNISYRNSLHRILPAQGPGKCPNRQGDLLPQVGQLDYPSHRCLREQAPLYPYTSRFPSLITTYMIFMRTVRDSRNWTRVVEVHPVPIDLFSDGLSDFCRATGGDNMMGAVDWKSLCLDTMISSATTIHLI